MRSVVLSAILVLLSTKMPTAFYNQPRYVANIESNALSVPLANAKEKLHGELRSASALPASARVTETIISETPSILRNLKYVVKVLLVAPLQRKVVIAVHVLVIALCMKGMSTEEFQAKAKNVISILRARLDDIDKQLQLNPIKIPGRGTVATLIRDLSSSCLALISKVRKDINTAVDTLRPPKRDPFGLAMKNKQLPGNVAVEQKKKGSAPSKPADKLQLALRSKPSPVEIRKEIIADDLIEGYEYGRKDEVSRVQIEFRREQQDRLDALRKAKKEEENLLDDMNRKIEEGTRSLAATKMTDIPVLESNALAPIRSNNFAAAEFSQSPDFNQFQLVFDKKLTSDIKMLSLAFTEDPEEFSEIRKNSAIQKPKSPWLKT